MNKRNILLAMALFASSQLGVAKELQQPVSFTDFIENEVAPLHQKLKENNNLLTAVALEAETAAVAQTKRNIENLKNATIAFFDATEKQARIDRDQKEAELDKKSAEAHVQLQKDKIAARQAYQATDMQLTKERSKIALDDPEYSEKNADITSRLAQAKKILEEADGSSSRTGTLQEEYDKAITEIELLKRDNSKNYDLAVAKLAEEREQLRAEANAAEQELHKMKELLIQLHTDSLADWTEVARNKRAAYQEDVTTAIKKGEAPKTNRKSVRYEGSKVVFIDLAMRRDTAYPLYEGQYDSLNSFFSQFVYRDSKGQMKVNEAAVTSLPEEEYQLLQLFLFEELMPEYADLTVSSTNKPVTKNENAGINVYVAAMQQCVESTRANGSHIACTMLPGTEEIRSRSAKRFAALEEARRAVEKAKEDAAEQLRIAQALKADSVKKSAAVVAEQAPAEENTVESLAAEVPAQDESFKDLAAEAEEAQ